jgi:indole-3-glycerol phosphate synthase/phosphoribosylanthranilate isomerase
VYGLTKVCGLTRAEDARAAWQAGATHGGLIFAPESPRAVSPARARAVRDAAPLQWVGVFVNADPELVAGIATDLELAAVQLHGEENAEYVGALRARLRPGTEIWRVVRIHDRLPDLAPQGADRLVLDRGHVGQRGGTGESFDWRLLESIGNMSGLILAGGLTPERVAAAEATGVEGLDVNSGVEEAPGIKSPARLAAFFAARRGPGRERTLG